MKQIIILYNISQCIKIQGNVIITVIYAFEANSMSRMEIK